MAHGLVLSMEVSMAATVLGAPIQKVSFSTINVSNLTLSLPPAFNLSLSKIEIIGNEISKNQNKKGEKDVL
jgi:hypothetical protein